MPKNRFKSFTMNINLLHYEIIGTQLLAAMRYLPIIKMLPIKNGIRNLNEKEDGNLYYPKIHVQTMLLPIRKWLFSVYILCLMILNDYLWGVI